nr:class I SAM-dependent methyltransferase [uncultured Pseudodesulfovibrio sp.]
MATESSHFPIDSHNTLFEIEKDHFWFQHRNSIIAEMIQKFSPDPHTFCEVGCGTGGVLWALGAKFPRMKLTAVELYTNALELVKIKVPQAEVVQADIHDLPYENEFNIVAAFDVIEHLDNDAEAVRMLAKSVKLGGCVILTVPQHEWLWSSMDEYACHRRRYNSKRLIQLMGQAQLEVLEVRSFFSLLLPLMYASRLTTPKAIEDYDPLREMMIPRMVNLTLKSVCWLERGIMKMGLRPPLGGSLAVVARKQP